MDGCIQFAFLTGVTKFSKVSVFSDLNNLDDISMRKQYVDICGVSEKELHDNLEIELHELADAKELTYGELCNRLRSTMMAIILHTILSEYIIRSACLILLNIKSSVVIGLKRELLLI